MKTLSCCLIVKNEKDCISTCLDSIYPLCDEIIIYDTGSNDGTQDICKAYDKVKLIQGEWRNDFGWARNESFKYATCDYVMWVDADDYINEKSVNELIKLKSQDFLNQNAIYIQYNYAYDKSYVFHRERIFKRSTNPYWVGKIHEYVNFNETKQPLYLNGNDVFIQHNHIKKESRNNRNLNIFLEMEKNNEIITPRDCFYFANELFEHNQIEKALEYYLKCLDITTWNIEKLNCYLRINNCYKILNKPDEGYKYLVMAQLCTLVPRADLCNQIGIYFQTKHKYKIAIKWFEIAYDNIPNENENALILSSAYTIDPLLNLVYTYWLMNDYNKALEYHKKCMAVNPNNENVKYNETFFKGLEENGILNFR